MSHKPLGQFPSNLVSRVAYTEGIKYLNLIGIGPLVIEIRGIENSEFVFPVNNTLVRHTVFLAAYTQDRVS